MEKKPKRWLGVLIMALILVSIGSLTSAEEKKPSKGKVAIVNGKVITEEEFNREVSRVRMQASKAGRNPSDFKLSETKKKILENLIKRELIYQESQKKGIKISEKTVTEHLMGIKKRFPNEAEFANALKRMNLSEAAYKTQIKQGLAIRRFIDEHFAEEIKITEKETRSYYEGQPNLFKKPEQVRASHILIKVDPQANESRDAEARKKLEKVRQKLQKGEDFASLAKEFSQGPSSTKGGDLGYFGRGQMVKPFEDVAFGLKPGEVSDIVKTKFGYHLIKVVDKKQKSTTSYAEVKDRIEQQLKRDKVQKKVGPYVEKLRENAKVEIFPAKDS